MATTAKLSKLSEVRKRLKSGKLTKKDVSALVRIVRDAENSTKRLRAAIIE